MRLTTKQIIRANEMRRAGMSLREVAGEFGVDEGSIREAEKLAAKWAASRHGAELPPCRDPNADRLNGVKLDFDCATSCPRASRCSRQDWRRGGEKARWTMEVQLRDKTGNACAWFVDRLLPRKREEF